MQTYATLTDARESLTIDAAGRYPRATTDKGQTIVAILEIEHDTEGHCYTRSLVNADQLRQAMEQSGKSMGIRRIVAEHDPIEDPEALRSEADRDYDAVARAENETDAAKNASYYDPARIAKAEIAERKAREQWEAKHPEAARSLRKRDRLAEQRRTNEHRDAIDRKLRMED